MISARQSKRYKRRADPIKYFAKIDPANVFRSIATARAKCVKSILSLKNDFLETESIDVDQKFNASSSRYNGGL